MLALIHHAEYTHIVKDCNRRYKRHLRSYNSVVCAVTGLTLEDLGYDSQLEQEISSFSTTSRLMTTIQDKITT